MQFAIILEGYGKEYDSYFDTHYSGAKIVRMNDGSLRRSKAISVSFAVKEAKLCLKQLNGK